MANRNELLLAEGASPLECVGWSVRTLREAQGWTAADLSSRLAAIGHPLDPAAVTRIERNADPTATQSSKRRGVTVEDLLALAVALEVSPVALLVPVGFIEEIKLTPGFRAVAWHASSWIAGLGPIASVEVVDAGQPVNATRWQTNTRPITLHRELDRLAARADNIAMEFAIGFLDRPDGESQWTDPRTRNRMLALHVEIADVLQHMMQAGMQPPAMHAQRLGWLALAGYAPHELGVDHFEETPHDGDDLRRMGHVSGKIPWHVHVPRLQVLGYEFAGWQLTDDKDGAA